MTQKEMSELGIMIFAYKLFFVISFLLLGCASGCGGEGDDDTNCGMTDHCGLDAGTMTDARDVCADYRWMTTSSWDCSDERKTDGYVCKLEANVFSGGCNIGCQDNFMFWVGEPFFTFSRTPPPAVFTYDNGSGAIKCTQQP